MKKFKIQLSTFDIGMIIAFAVVGLLGAGAWYYLSGQLQTAQAADNQVASDYQNTAVKNGIIVSQANAKAVQANAGVLKTAIDPVISTYFLAKDNGLAKVTGEDPVAWKHDLDDDIKTLSTDAKARGVILPDHFYFGFSRYQTESPNDAATAVLTKQRYAIKAIVEILVKSPVHAITRVQRSYEEDPHALGSGAEGGDPHTEGDQLAGYAAVIPNTYTAYPFEVDFDSDPEALRPILDGLIQSPYVFIVRTVEVHNDKLDSPRVSDLAQIAGSGGGGAPSVVSSAPGDVAATTAPTLGPQHLFGYSTLHVKLRIDLIEWNPQLASVDDLNPPKKKP